MTVKGENGMSSLQLLTDKISSFNTQYATLKDAADTVQTMLDEEQKLTAFVGDMQTQIQGVYFDDLATSMKELKDRIKVKVDTVYASIDATGNNKAALAQEFAKMLVIGEMLQKLNSSLESMYKVAPPSLANVYQLIKDMLATPALLPSGQAFYEPDGWNLEIGTAACIYGRSKNERGAYIGNGKLGIFADFMGCGLQQCRLAGSFKVNKGVYTSNTMDAFRTTAWRPFSAEPSHVQTTPVLQRLNMRTGILTTENTFVDTRQEPPNPVTISCDTYAPRQFPYCVVQTLRVSCRTPAEVLLFHEVEAPGGATGVDFASNMIDVDVSSAGASPVTMLSGRGVVGADGFCVCFASCVLFEDDMAGHKLLGFNVYKTSGAQPPKCYVKLGMQLTAKQSRLHCVTVHMSNFDFEDPYEQCKMVVLSIMNRPALLSLNSIQRLRHDHVTQWDNLWKADIVIKPRSGTFVLQPSETAQLQRVQRKLRQDLYMVFSCARENVEVEVNPGTFSVLDTGNDTMYDGDLFLVPLLMFVMPNAARSLLEYRYKQLSSAVQLAASYGFGGAKYPYNNDVMGYRNALYWESMAPMYLFNNALIALNAWNYYRATTDKEWLQNKGYAIIKACVEFLVGRCTVDEDGIYHLNDVMAFNRHAQPSHDNSFTNNTVKLATRALIEASYELGYAVKPEWHDVVNKLPINVVRGGFAPQGNHTHHVVLYDGRSTPAKLIDESYDILEPLLILSPAMSDLYFAPGSGHDFESIKRNVEFYTRRMSPAYSAHPLNRAILLMAYGKFSKFSKDMVPSMETCMEGMCADMTRTVWGQELNTTVAAMLPLAMINAVAGINIQGGVSESRFYYDEMTIKGVFASNMPRHWDQVIVSNCGPMRKAWQVCNPNL